MSTNKCAVTNKWIGYIFREIINGNAIFNNGCNQVDYLKGFVFTKSGRKSRH